jgi:hypothetical protein
MVAQREQHNLKQSIADHQSRLQQIQESCKTQERQMDMQKECLEKRKLALDEQQKEQEHDWEERESAKTLQEREETCRAKIQKERASQPVWG